MIDVMIIWDDGTMFQITSQEEQPDLAMAEIKDLIREGEPIYGRWAPGGVPQEQFRLLHVYDRGIRCLSVDM